MEHGKVLMMETWATFIFTNRNRAGEEDRERSSERVDKNYDSMVLQEPKDSRSQKKKMGTEDQPYQRLQKGQREQKSNNVNGFSSYEVSALSAFGFRMLEGLIAEGEITAVQDSGVNCGL